MFDTSPQLDCGGRVLRLDRGHIAAQSPERGLAKGVALS